VQTRDAVVSSNTVFDEGSPAYLEALHGLRAVLEYVGFHVVKKADAEGTLRVYPRRIHRYPLLNPRFVRRSRRGELEIHVWSKADNSRLDRALQSYARSTGSRFMPSGERVREHVLHGRLYLPVDVRDRQTKVPNFATLGRRLKTLHVHLDKAA
jgi:hypothetical protein